MDPQSNIPHDEVIVPATDGTNSWNAHPAPSVSFIAPPTLAHESIEIHTKSQPEPVPVSKKEPDTRSRSRKRRDRKKQVKAKYKALREK